MLTSILFGMSGWMISIIMRFELAKPVVHVIGHDTCEVYNMLITLHGITMIFFLVMPNLFGGQGNTWMPLNVGTCEVAYPKINNGSLSVLIASFCCALSAVGGEFLNGLGWVLYAPLSTGMMTLSGVTLVALAATLLVNGTSSSLTSTNYLGTMAFTKVGGLSLQLYATTICTAALLLLASLPSLTGGLAMLVADVVGNTTYFSADNGGDVVMWQHLFWIFGHPEVYVLILPALGVMSVQLSAVAGASTFGTTGMVAGTAGIAAVGLVVWAHHLFTTGMDVDTAAVFSMFTLLVSIPSGVKALHAAGSAGMAGMGLSAHLSTGGALQLAWAVLKFVLSWNGFSGGLCGLSMDWLFKNDTLKSLGEGVKWGADKAGQKFVKAWTLACLGDIEEQEDYAWMRYQEQLKKELIAAKCKGHTPNWEMHGPFAPAIAGASGGQNRRA